ncbi:hypothetical protein ACHAWT_002129 [Skeletonema menzelii]
MPLTMRGSYPQELKSVAQKPELSGSGHYASQELVCLSKLSSSLQQVRSKLFGMMPTLRASFQTKR